MKIALSFSEPFSKEDPDFNKKQKLFDRLKKTLFSNLADKRLSVIFGGDMINTGLANMARQIWEQRNCKQKIENHSFWPIQELIHPFDKKRNSDIIEFIETPFYRHADLIEKPDCDPLEFLKDKSPRNRWILSHQLTRMRVEIAKKADAFIFVGGKVSGFMGKYPGVLEELFWAINEKNKPIYLLGGFGGVVELAAKECLLKYGWPKEFTTTYQREHTDGYSDFLDYVSQNINLGEMVYPDFEKLCWKISTNYDRIINNGLNLEQNQTLFDSSDISEIESILKYIYRSVCNAINQ